MTLNSPFWWQMLILVTGCISAMMSGFLISFVAVLNPSILNPNSTDIRATLAEASFIGSAPPYAGTIGFLILPVIMQAYGRRIAHFVIAGTILLGWIMIAVAKNTTTLIIGRCFQGLSIGALVINSIVVGEYCNPEWRGHFIAIKKCSVPLGMLVSHVLMKYLYWRKIAGFFIAVNLVFVFLICFWPESPAFFAFKGNFNDCEKVFIKLRGDTIKSRKELEEMIAAQRKRSRNTENKSLKLRLINVTKKFLMKDFQKAFVIAVLLVTLVELSGRHFLGAYLVDMLIELIGEKSIALNFSIGNHTLSIVAALFGGILMRFFDRRTILFSFGALSSLIMFVIVGLTILKSYFANSIFDWLTVSVLIIFSFVGQLGVSPVAFTLIGEVFPLEHRGVGTSVTGIAMSTILGLNFQTTPLLFKYIGLAFTFLIFGIISVASLVIIFFILPETKDKTLQEIENVMKGTKSVSLEVEPILSTQKTDK